MGSRAASPQRMTLVLPNFIHGFPLQQYSEAVKGDKQMNPHSYSGVLREAFRLRWTFAMTVALALAGCATTAPRQSVSATPAPTAQPVDSERRNRQFQHAEALYLSGHLKEAASAFEQLSRDYPNDGRIWLKYGNTLTKLGNYDNAALAFQTAMTTDPGQGGAPLNLALVRLAQAQEALEVALGRLPSGSSEQLQAEALRRQIKALLGPQSGAPSH